MREGNLQEQMSDELRKSSIIVPEGEFQMGGTSLSNENPSHRVYLDAFLICKFLVTKAQFVAFLNTIKLENEIDGLYIYLNTLNKMSRIRREESLYLIDIGFEDHPITCVNWFGSSAFAAWVGGRLPTEAEWEKAARGGLTGDVFPWGEGMPNHALANYAENVGFTTPVGKYPSNKLGLHDMAGNAWQWCKDWYHRDYYKRSRIRNPQGPNDGTDKVIRGGGWAYNADSLRCAKREKRWARVGGTNVSFRVVFDVKTEGLRKQG